MNKAVKNLIYEIIGWVLVVGTFGLYVLIDYLSLKFDGGVITDVNYWVGIGISAFLFCSIMVVVRDMRKRKNIDKDDLIKNLYDQNTKAFKFITNNGHSERLEKYILEVNENSKYDTFIRRITIKLQRCKKDVKRRKLEELLKTPREEVLKKHFKYSKISYVQLFAGIDGKVISDDENDLSTHETRDISKMLGSKTLLLVLFSAFTGSLITDLIHGGTGAIFSTLIKTLSMIISVWTAITTADNFVENSIKISLKKRYKHITTFVTKNEDISKDLKLKLD